MDMRSERLLLNITFDRVYDDEPSQMKAWVWLSQF